MTPETLQKGKRKCVDPLQAITVPAYWDTFLPKGQSAKTEGEWCGVVWATFLCTHSFSDMTHNFWQA